MIRVNKSVLFSTSLLNPIFVFVLSIFSCLLVLFIERNLGISWDFHPDAVFYINNAEAVTNSIGKFTSVINNGFYYVVNFFNSDIKTIIYLNILIYSITNLVLAIFYLNNCQSYSKSFHSLLFLLVLFNPYRLHLADHVLKDSIVIALLVFFAVSQHRPLKLTHFILLFFFRIGSFIYLIAFIRFKEILKTNLPTLIFFTLFILGMVIYSWDRVLEITFDTTASPDMSFREFDLVPNFYELHLLGSILRALLWPFLYMTGTFIFISPSIMYFPIALGAFILQLWCITHFKKLGIYLSIYISMGIFAFIVTGFTSFIRYSMPLFTIIPIIMIQRESNNS
tara:strand:- start:5097 stop:6110 length:1014 start_codon:yes stop_codon:yes gene_type:complete